MKTFFRGLVSWRAALVAVALSLVSGATWAQLPAGGTLYLELGAVDQFRWVGPGATPETLTQSIKDMRDITGKSNDACKLALASSPQLATLTSASGTVGFNNQKDWIGVREQSRGVDCGRLVSGQSITLALGSALSGYAVSSSTLEINAKKNAVVRAIVSAEGSSKTFVLKTGLSATGTPGPNEQFCFPGVSDSSPDSRANCAWSFGGPWTSVTFVTDAGEWSLASGTSASSFTLIEFSGLLGCPSIGGEEIPEVLGPNGLRTSGYRLENAADPLIEEPTPSCVVVPYVYSATCPAELNLPPETACTNFTYDPLNQGTHMAFYFRWNWPPEAVPAGGIDDLEETLQFFLNGNSIGVELDICPEIRPMFEDPNNTPDDPTDDVFLGVDPDYPPADQDTTVPGTQAGCLITRQVIQNGIEVLVVEGAYVQGDYLARRG
jgi:hypothetical protein